MAIKRILQVFTVMDRGGAESMIMNYYREIDKTKIQFDFLVHREKQGIFEEEILRLGGKIYRMPAINPILPKKYYSALRFFFSKHSQYSIIHSHLNTFSSFPLKIAEEFNIPFRIAHAHIALEKINFKNILFSKKHRKEEVKKLVKFQLRKKIHKNPTHLFSCGDKAGKWLFGKNAVFVKMNNAIFSKDFTFNKKIRKKYRASNNIENSLIIGHIGRFNSQKNHSFLINVFSELLKKNKNSILLLIGDGALKKDLENQVNLLGIGEHVKFLGVRTDIPNWLQAIDVFVFPSIYEGLPVTLIEAQAAGLKIVASDKITREVAITSNIEFLSTSKSTEYWAKKILNISSYNRKETNDSIIDNNYDIQVNCKKIEEFYLNDQTQ